MAVLKWMTGTSTAYKALDPKDENCIYFLNDTKEIYKGVSPFTESIIFYETDLPTMPAWGKLYVKTSTLEGVIWNGTEWKTVLQSPENQITADNITRAVTGKAVVDYISGALQETNKTIITDISYDENTKSINFTKDGKITSLNITKLVSDISYDQTTGKLSITDSAGTILDEVNLVDNFVKSGHYDSSLNSLVLEMQNGAIIAIPATVLAAVYEAGETSSVKISIETITDTDGKTNNVLKADLKISAEGGNALSIKDDGLYVAPTDISGKMDKLNISESNSNEVLIIDLAGNAILSGTKIGTDTISVNPNKNTLATELAVSNIKTALETYIESVIKNYIEKSNIVKTTADINYTSPSMEKVISEAAFVGYFSSVIPGSDDSDEDPDPTPDDPDTPDNPGSDPTPDTSKGIMEVVSKTSDSSAYDSYNNDYMQNECKPGDVFEVTLAFAARNLRCYKIPDDVTADTLADSISSYVLFAMNDLEYEGDILSVPEINGGIRAVNAKYYEYEEPNTNPNNKVLTGTNFEYTVISTQITVPSSCTTFGKSCDLTTHKLYFDWGVSVSLQPNYTDPLVQGFEEPSYGWLYSASLKKNGTVIKTIEFENTLTDTLLTNGGRQIISGSFGETPYTRYGFTES
jgi:hypothetical protein